MAKVGDNDVADTWDVGPAEAVSTVYGDSDVPSNVVTTGIPPEVATTRVVAIPVFFVSGDVTSTVRESQCSLGQSVGGVLWSAPDTAGVAGTGGKATRLVPRCPDEFAGVTSFVTVLM